MYILLKLKLIFSEKLYIRLSIKKYKRRGNIITQKSHVHCTVENCQWFKEPNLCIAEKLLVVSDDFAKELPNETDVEQTNQIISQKGLSPITECYQSCCKTFVPRDKFESGLGGTNK